MDGILILCYVYVFMLGCVIASFLNVVIYRLPLGLDYVKGRSFCPKCKKQLKAIDMIPIFSWLFLRGKCRFCHEPISPRYPIIEAIGGILGVWGFAHFGFSYMSIIAFVLGMVLICITMIDYDTMIIPNGLVVWVLLCGVFSIFVYPELSIINRIIGMFIISVPMILLNLVIESFGGGDIKLMFVAGLLLGVANSLLTIFIAVLIGGIYAIYLLLTKKIDKKGQIAFGPYICVGIWLSFMYGDVIINSYLSFFGL